MAIVKSGPEGKEAILAYMSSAINLNLSRGKMQVDPATVSTDGFMMNVTGVLLKLAEPIVDLNLSKLKLIDPRYFCRESSRVGLFNAEVTRINADQETTDAFFANVQKENPQEGAANFVTDIFFLTAGALHYGLGSARRVFTDIHRDIDDKRRVVKEFQGSTDIRYQAHVQKLLVS